MRVELSIEPGRGGWVSLSLASKGAMRVGHRHEELEVNLCLAGRASYVLEGRRYEMGRDSLVWLFPEQEHMLLEKSPDFRMWIAVFRPELVKSCVGEAEATSRHPAEARDGPQVLARADPPGSFNRQVTEPVSRRLAALFARLHERGARDEDAGSGEKFSAPHYRTGLAWLLRECWHAFERAEDVPAGAHLHPAVERTARRLHDHPETRNLRGLAREAGLSPWWLSRLFRRQTGLSLTEFRNRQRVRRVIERLGRGDANGRHNLTQTAFAAGFTSYSHFYRVFREHTGQSPAAFARGGEAPSPARGKTCGASEQLAAKPPDVASPPPNP